MSLMDTDKAVEVGRLVLAAYEVDATDLTNTAGGELIGGYTVVSTVYSNDLGTDVSPEAAFDTVAIGLLAQNAAGDVVVALRGTEGVLEWLHNAEFSQAPFFPHQFQTQSLGFTEIGFTAMYKSLRIAPKLGADPVVMALSDLKYPQPAASITLAGHGIGAPLVNMLALDLAYSNRMSCAVYTYGSPRACDPTFVSAYNQLVPNTWRIFNRLDIVPNMPFSGQYQHVGQPVDLNPAQLDPFELLVNMNIVCEHDPYTYLGLLSGGEVDMQAGCQPS